MKQLEHIGTIEMVSLPDDQIEGVPAKIDTGADGSSIWASNMRVRAGRLYFNFFAPGSSYYREKPVRTSAFRVTTVRNSFGHKEFRYKIKLRVTVGNYTLRRWFTLADRSRNTYPILLGKNYLKNKFVVDVSQKHIVGDQPGLSRVLIFTSQPEENQAFFDEVTKLNKTNVSYHYVAYKDLIFHFNGPKTTITNFLTGEDIGDYDFTYFKNHHNNEFAYSVAEYLQYKGKPFVDREYANYLSASKLSEYSKLVCHGINLVKTICASTHILQDKFDELKATFDLPFVLKEIRSDRGRHNYLIRTKKDYNKILSEAPDKHVYAVQRYVDNDGFYRLYVMGKDVSLAIWRSATPHQDRLKQHLNKPRGGANAKLVPLKQVPGEVHDQAVRAANYLDRQICGVDLVQDKKTGIWYVLEANNDPQIRSGSFIPAKAKMVAKFFDKELNH